MAPRVSLLRGAALASAALLCVSQAPLPPTPQMAADAAAIIAAAAAANFNAWNRLAYVTDTFGPRFSGSDALNDTISWIAETAAADPGLVVTMEPVLVPRWVRGDEWATLDSPRGKKLHFCGLGYSNSTPFGAPLTADVLVISNYTELQAKAAQAVGKIVLFDWTTWEGYGNTVTYRVNAATWAASVGAAAALIKSIAPYGIQTCHTGGSQTAAVPAGAVSREDALQMRRMQERGQRVVVTMQMPAALLEPRVAWNLLIDYTSPGASFPDEYSIISGHMDSWDIAEGGMDDGGGFFSAWEAVRLIASLGLHSNRTIRAIGFVDEEGGGVGADQYGRDYNATFAKTSFAMESDTGAFALWGLSYVGGPAGLAQLQALSPLLAPLNASNVAVGGSDTDEAVLCAAGVPCAALWPYDPRVSAAANNPCAPYSTALVPPSTASFSVSDGYMWCAVGVWVLYPAYPHARPRDDLCISSFPSSPYPARSQVPSHGRRHGG